MPDADLILYRHVGCPYCEHVVRVLQRHEVLYRSRFVTPAHSERDHIKRISGGRSVPVIVDRETGVTMAESANIVEYLDRSHVDGPVDEESLYVDFPESDHLREGETAPNIQLPLVGDEYWENASLSAMVDDGPTLLVFYPMDGTGSASYTWIKIRDRGWDPETVVGISISTPYEHREFIHRHNLPYRLYSDPGNKTAEAFGVVHDHGGMAGLEGARPATFLLEPDLTVSFAWVSDRWPESIPYDVIEERLDQSSS